MMAQQHGLEGLEVVRGAGIVAEDNYWQPGGLSGGDGGCRRWGTSGAVHDDCVGSSTLQVGGELGPARRRVERRRDSRDAIADAGGTEERGHEGRTVAQREGDDVAVPYASSHEGRIHTG